MSAAPSESNRAPSGSLRRDLGLIDSVGVGLGAVMGAGIFVVTGLAAGAAGPSFLAGLIIAGLAAVCNGLSSAQLAAVYPQSGGTYEYGYCLLRPWLGFSAGWMFLISKLAAGGTVALGFGYYLSQWMPGISPPIAGCVAVVFLTAANLAGVKKAGRLNLCIVTVTLASLAYFILSGASQIQSSNFRPFLEQGWLGLGEASAMLFFAYTGYARLATLGEEVRHPEKTIPRAIVITLGVSMVVYFLVGLVAVGALGARELAQSGSPLQQAAAAFTWPGSVAVISLGGLTALVGVLLSQILGISRMMLAMARRGDLPSQLRHIQAARAVPDAGILLTGLIIAAFCWIGELKWIVQTAAFTILIYYFITNLAALRLKPEQRLFPRWIAAFGLLFCLGLAFSLSVQTIGQGILWLVIGFILRAALRFPGKT